MDEIATTPKPPYYAVIFTSLRTDGHRGYAETAVRQEPRMHARVMCQAGEGA